MAIDVVFDILPLAQQKTLISVPASSVVVRARRQVECLYDYKGRRTLLVGDAVGDATVTVRMMPAALPDATRAVAEGSVPGTLDANPFKLKVGGLLSIEGCRSLRADAPPPVSMAAGDLDTVSYSIAFSGAKAGCAATTRGNGDAPASVFPSMPDLSGLTVETVATPKSTSHAFANLAPVNASGLPDFSVRISGFLRNNASRNSSFIPLLENAPPVAAGYPQGNPLMTVWLGGGGGRMKVKYGVNTESAFEFSTDDNGLVLVKASRTFRVFPELAADLGIY